MSEPEIAVGQIWQDNDARFQNSQRLLRIVELLPNGAVVENVLTGKRSTILRRRFKPTSTGYRLVVEVTA